MNYKIKFILLVLLNILSMISFFIISNYYQWDIEQRVIDVDIIHDQNDFNLFICISLLFVLVILINYILFSWKEPKITESEIKVLSKAFR